MFIWHLWIYVLFLKQILYYQYSRKLGSETHKLRPQLRGILTYAWLIYILEESSFYIHWFKCGHFLHCVVEGCFGSLIARALLTCYIRLDQFIYTRHLHITARLTSLRSPLGPTFPSSASVLLNVKSDWTASPGAEWYRTPQTTFRDQNTTDVYCLPSYSHCFAWQTESNRFWWLQFVLWLALN